MFAFAETRGMTVGRIFRVYIELHFGERMDVMLKVWPTCIAAKTLLISAGPFAAAL